MTDPQELLGYKWGYARLERGDVLCVRITRDKVILVEARGGFMWLSSKEVEPAPAPTYWSLVSALTGLSVEQLPIIATEFMKPQSQVEIETSIGREKSNALIGCKLLGCIGKQRGRNAWAWQKQGLDQLLAYVLELGSRPTRMPNNPRRR
jgi:hypothetical protein